MSLQVPRDAVPVRVQSVRYHPPSNRHVVVLQESAGERWLGIWTGPAEANAIAVALQGEAPGQPLTADLTAALCRVAKLKVDGAYITQPPEASEYAAMLLGGGGLVPARPSDAIALAMRLGAPIRVSAALLRPDLPSPPTQPVPGRDRVGAGGVSRLRGLARGAAGGRREGRQCCLRRVGGDL